MPDGVLRVGLTGGIATGKSYVTRRLGDAGLPTIDADRLSQIRENRRPDSKYASIKQCHWEVEAAESLMRMAGIPVFNTTHSSIEEIGSRVLAQLGLQREMF